uniref:Bm6063 n=1 Tax=Brugia malayi TaxID=6279 RepID=A0A1I9GCT4_BRUMA|nr:Bm6063 [Brugia malayi]
MWIIDNKSEDEAKTLKEKQSEKNGYLYTSAEGYLRDKSKFQHTRREYSYLPYYENISRNSSFWLEQIKAGLAASTLSYAADSGISFWMNQLSHDEIIKRNDVTLPWRPIYDLYIEVAFKRNSKNLEKSNIRSAVLAVKELFPLSATKEILDEIRPFIDVWNDYAMIKFVNLFSAFIPLKMSNEEHDLYGAGLWYDEIWISEYCPGYIDWSSKYTIIFSKLLRALNLSVRYNKVAVGDGTGMGSESSGAEWIIWMLGGMNESAHRCFERLIKCVESFLHPLHEGGHTPTLQSFLDALVSEMVRRIRIERVRQKTRNKVPSEMRFTDEQIEWFVSTLLPSVLYSVFSTTETSASNVMRNLAFLAPQLVLPKCLDLIYTSLSTITEPHRLKQSLECIVEICVPLVRDNGTYSYRTYNVCKQNWIDDINKITEDKEYISTPSTVIDELEVHSDNCRVPLREHAIFLLEILIEAIDINDFQKLSLSLQTLETIFQLVPIVNCSAALEMTKYMDLNEEEKRLCKLTARFPNIVQNFVNKVFKVITQLSSSAPSDGISYVDSICDNSDVILMGSEEIVISATIQSAFHALFFNCSSSFVELIGDHTYKFISTSEFESAVAADAAFSLMQESIYGACWSLKNVLTQLTEVYPISEEDQQHNLDLPLHLSLPIKKWGVKCLKDVVTIKWHIPTEAEVDFAEKLLDEFACSEVQLLTAPASMDKFAIKRSLIIIYNLLSCVGNRLPIFNTKEIKLSETVVDMDPICITSVSPRIKMFSFNGENIREKVRIVMHNLMEFLLSQQDGQSKNLFHISSVLHALCIERVRIASQATLMKLIAKFPNSKYLLVDDVLEHLDPKRNISHEEMKGALYILKKCGFLTSNAISPRCKCWLAIAKLKVSEKPSIITLVQRCTDSVSTKQWTIQRNINSTNIRVTAQELFTDINANNTFYAKYQELSHSHAILMSKNKFTEKHRKNYEKISSFRNELIEICKNKGQLYHWRQIDSARTFLFTLHRNFFTVEVAEVFDPKFKYACGLRPDNLCIVYNRDGLPKDEQTWNGTIFVSKPHWGAYQWPKKLVISAPANAQTELQRSMSEFNDVEKLILEYMKDKQFIILWHTILLKEKEDSDVFYAGECRLVKNGRSLIRRTQTKLAAIYCAGIIRGSRNWLFNDLQEMWVWLKPIIVYHIEGLMSETVYHWDIALKFCLDITDVRRFHWLIETLFEIALKPAPTTWHRCVRLGLIHYISSCSAWRTTELLNQVINIANVMISQSWLATEREQIASVLSFPAVYGFAMGDENNIPMKYRIPKLAEIIDIFDTQIKEMMKSRKIQVNKRGASPEVKSKQIASSPSPPSATVTLLKNSPNDETEVVRDADLTIGASDVLFQSWSGIYLCDELADEMLNSVEQTMNVSTSWKAWVSIMKFLHVFIFSNILVCEKQKRREIVQRMIYNAIRHAQLEVRREAADCLTALIHCGFQSLTSCYIKELFKCTNHKTLSERHGAVLALSAVIRAFPFTIPALVFDMIPKYCQLGINSDSLIRNTVTETLRSFLRTHHDKMIETGEKDVIQKLLVFIQNVISPNYYKDCLQDICRHVRERRTRHNETCKYISVVVYLTVPTVKIMGDIIEEYEKIKKAECDRMSLRQNMASKKILSADRVEDLLCFPVDFQENLRKTDRIYMTDDNRRLLLIREYNNMGDSKSVKLVF